MRSVGCVAAVALLLGGCGEETPSFEPPPTTLDTELRQSLERWRVVPIGSMPEQRPAEVELGRVLFFDPVLSGNRDVACATCHHPETALADGRSLPVGTGGSGRGPSRTPGPDRELVPRASPSLLNAGLGARYMLWDGRLSSFGAVRLEAGPPLPSDLPHALAAQALLPVLDRTEMRGEPGDRDVFGEPNELAEIPDDRPDEIWAAVMARLLEVPQYVSFLGAAFPDTPAGRLRFEHAARALAAFQMEAFNRARSPFDRYLEGDDFALNERQKRGALLFFDQANCASCHGGPLLGGESFANVGAPQVGPGVGREKPLDLGRGEVVDRSFYRFAFRVPPLRNVELTAPYMHSGAYPTLEAVVRHYSDVEAALRGYDVAQLEPALRGLHHGDEATIADLLGSLDFRVATPLDLSEDEIADLVAFLEALTDPAARDLGVLAPEAVPSGLPVP